MDHQFKLAILETYAVLKTAWFAAREAADDAARKMQIFDPDYVRATAAAMAGEDATESTWEAIKENSTYNTGNIAWDALPEWLSERAYKLAKKKASKSVDTDDAEEYEEYEEHTQKS